MGNENDKLRFLSSNFIRSCLQVPNWKWRPQKQQEYWNYRMKTLRNWIFSRLHFSTAIWALWINPTGRSFNKGSKNRRHMLYKLIQQAFQAFSSWIRSSFLLAFISFKLIWWQLEMTKESAWLSICNTPTIWGCGGRIFERRFLERSLSIKIPE